VKYAGEVAKSVAAVKAIGVDATAEEELMNEIALNLNLFHEKLKLLTEVTEQANLLKGDSKSQAIFCRDYVFQTMKELREPADRLEMLVDEENWPFPTYGELLYNI
jgi:glutamine synthetase